MRRSPSDRITPPMSGPAPSKRLFIKTYGCQMNVYDSERMADVLSPLGYAMTDTPDGADLVVLNANPLDDIRNTKTIDSVWIAGNKVQRP